MKGSTDLLCRTAIHIEARSREARCRGGCSRPSPESAATASLVIAFLVAARLLLAIATVRAVGAAGVREQRPESLSTQVPAVMSQSAGAGLSGLDGGWNASWVMAKWTAPDGAHQSGMVLVALSLGLPCSCR